MDIEREIACQTPIRQNSAKRLIDSEFSIDTGNKYKMRPAYSTKDTNLTREKGRQNSHSTAGVC